MPNNLNGGVRVPTKLFATVDDNDYKINSNNSSNLDNSIMGLNNRSSEDHLNKKRKRYIKNNKFVYVHPDSTAAKILEREEVIFSCLKFRK